MNSITNTKQAFDTGYQFTKLTTSHTDARTMAMAYIMGIAYKMEELAAKNELPQPENGTNSAALLAAAHDAFLEGSRRKITDLLQRMENKPEAEKEIPGILERYLRNNHDNKLPAGSKIKEILMTDDSHIKVSLPCEFLHPENPFDGAEDGFVTLTKGGNRWVHYFDDPPGETGTPSVKEAAPVKGGSYERVKASNKDPNFEVHHIISAYAIKKTTFLPPSLTVETGPSILISKKDHTRTKSYGRKQIAKDYREEQLKLLQQHKYREAIQMDIDDLRELFGSKYDSEIAEMLQYADELLDNLSHGVRNENF